MADKTIIFTQGVKYDSIPPVVYAAGQKVTLREDLANRWLTRGVATEDEEVAKAKKRESEEAEAAKKSKPSAKAPAVDIPPDWKFYKPDDKIALAKKLGAPDGVTAQAAGDAIEAEVKKRDAAAK